MADQYVTRKNGKTGRPWSLNHVDRHKEFGFDKVLGYFRTREDAFDCAEKIRADSHWNFGKWFWPNYYYFNESLITREQLANQLRIMWKNVSGHTDVLEIPQKLEPMIVLLGMMSHQHVLIVNDLETDHALELAGEGA